MLPGLKEAVSRKVDYPLPVFTFKIVLYFLISVTTDF